MALPDHLLIHQVVRVRPIVGAADSYGNQVKDYGAAAVRTTVPGRLQQDSQTEQFPDGRQPAESIWTLFTNEGDIDRHDRIEWEDHPTGAVVFEVHGRSEPTYSDVFDHSETKLRILEG